MDISAWVNQSIRTWPFCFPLYLFKSEQYSLFPPNKLVAICLLTCKNASGVFLETIRVFFWVVFQNVNEHSMHGILIRVHTDGGTERIITGQL